MLVKGGLFPLSDQVMLLTRSSSLHLKLSSSNLLLIGEYLLKSVNPYLLHMSGDMFPPG